MSIVADNTNNVDDELLYEATIAATVVDVDDELLYEATIAATVEATIAATVVDVASRHYLHYITYLLSYHCTSHSTLTNTELITVKLIIN